MSKVMNYAYLPTKKATLGAACATLLLGLFYSRYTSQTISQIPSPDTYECKPHTYTTEIVSVDPLLIYINSFISPLEADLLVALGTPELAKSEIYIGGAKVSSSTRTSRSGGLPPSSPLVSCILSRALSFLGPALPSTSPPSSHLNPNPNPNPNSLFGTPQIVQYGPGEKFDTHHDWYDRPQILRDGSMDYLARGAGGGRWWFNRWGSFFVYLDESAVEGETWFPHIEARDGAAKVEGDSQKRDGGVKWRKRDGEGGTSFLPKKGNALFWVNLHANGTGDERVVHAGLEVTQGRKTAMNIWPRTYYGGGR